jgi:PKD repeat protein
MSQARVVQWVLVAGFAGITACGGDSSGPPAGGTPPIANFSVTCVDLSCDFQELSSDADGQVTSFSWDWGDASAKGSGKAPTHTYAAGGDKMVKLTVTDNDGDQGNVTKTVTVSAPQNGAPTANFGISCSSLDCTFTDQSTDADGTVVGWAWDFGDGAVSAVQNPASHHYNVSALTLISVKLTVTDNLGLTSTKTSQFTVSPPAMLMCDGTACTLVLDQASTVVVTLESSECTARNNSIVITAPVLDTLFTDGCYSPTPGTPEATFQLNNGAAFVAGTQLSAEVLSGSLRQEVAPAVRVTGAFPTWTIEFDDGEDATPPEPDFNDLVISVTATPTP